MAGKRPNPFYSEESRWLHTEYNCFVSAEEINALMNGASESGVLQSGVPN